MADRQAANFRSYKNIQAATHRTKEISTNQQNRNIIYAETEYT
jgi:hypothetical protein